jgi:hypothetical protein
VLAFGHSLYLHKYKTEPEKELGFSYIFNLSGYNDLYYGLAKEADH